MSKKDKLFVEMLKAIKKQSNTTKPKRAEFFRLKSLKLYDKIKKLENKEGKKQEVKSFTDRFIYCADIDENRKRANKARKKSLALLEELKTIVDKASKEN